MSLCLPDHTIDRLCVKNGGFYYEKIYYSMYPIIIYIE